MGTRGGPSLLGAPIISAALLACAPVALAGPDCRPSGGPIELPDVLVETSGVAVGRLDPGVIWTHNDDGSTLFAVDSIGRILDAATVRPRLRDWEDLAVGACEAHGSCLYLADTGDNGERRPAGDVRILRLPEPELPLEAPLRAEAFPVRLPEGPRDVEALFVLPGEHLHLVTKGRNHAITVYRYPPPLGPDTVTLVELQRLTGGAQPLANQVTGASAAGRGAGVVAIRTYQAMAFYRVAGDTLHPVEDGLVNLRPLRETQGEGVGLGLDGRVVLTSEGGIFGAAPTMNRLRCLGLTREAAPVGSPGPRGAAVDSSIGRPPPSPDRSGARP